MTDEVFCFDYGSLRHLRLTLGGVFLSTISLELRGLQGGSKQI